MANSVIHQQKKKRRIRRKQAIYKIQVNVYDYGFAPFGEPTKAKLESLPFYKRILRTYRFDYEDFTFVRCLINGEFTVISIRFQPNLIDRSSCQLLAKWDPHASLKPMPAKKK